MVSRGLMMLRLILATGLPMKGLMFVWLAVLHILDIGSSCGCISRSISHVAFTFQTAHPYLTCSSRSSQCCLTPQTDNLGSSSTRLLRNSIVGIVSHDIRYRKGDFLLGTKQSWHEVNED